MRPPAPTRTARALTATWYSVTGQSSKASGEEFQLHAQELTPLREAFGSGFSGTDTARHCRTLPRRLMRGVWESFLVGQIGTIPWKCSGISQRVRVQSQSCFCFSTPEQSPSLASFNGEVQNHTHKNEFSGAWSRGPSHRILGEHFGCFFWWRRH